MASLQDRQEGIIVKLFDLVHEADSYQPPELSVGDRILKGKFKNSPAEITGFTQDKHNQPVLKTNRGEVQLFKPRVTKLMDKDVAEDRESIPSGKKRITWNGIDLVVSIDGATVDIRAMTGDSQMAYVVFDRDGDTLVADDLAVEEQYKGQGIAKIMYNYVKELGFRVKRSSDQLVAGKKFWDKNKGAENNIWEQGVVEGFLNEGLSHPVIVVDVQPEYSGMNDGDESSVFPQIINFVNKQTGPVLMFVNAEDQGLSGDTIQDIKQYWDDTICPEEERYTHDEETDDYIENPNCPKINWQRFAIADKGYGYFRSWMDHGIEPATIVATIRELYQQKKSDSRELQFPAFNKRTPQQSLIMGAMQEMEDDPISVNWTSVSQLKRFNGAYIVGGARDQCLREVELLMNAFNIKYKRIDSLIYEGQQGVTEGLDEAVDGNFLYHGSESANISGPLRTSERDSGWFGSGFYLTAYPEYAKRWGQFVYRTPWPKGDFAMVTVIGNYADVTFDKNGQLAHDYAGGTDGWIRDEYAWSAKFKEFLVKNRCVGVRVAFDNKPDVEVVIFDPNNAGVKLTRADQKTTVVAKKEQGVAEGLIDYAQRKLGLKWGKIGDVVNGSVVAEYLDSQDDSMDTNRYIKSKFKLINITANEAEKYREISDLNGWPSDTPLEKVKGWGIDNYKMDRIRKNDVTYQSLMKHTPVVSSRGFIINGNHRVARALEMGIDPIPILKELQQGVAEGTEEVNPLTNAVISFYKPVVDQIEPGAVDDYVKQAKELLNQAPDPTIRSRMLEIFRKGQKDPMIQGGVVTAIAAILTGGLLSSASRMGLSPAQTNILLQAVLNTVIPTIIARINNKSWRDTIKYTLASVGVGMTAAATLSEKRVTKVASNTIPTMGINIRSDGNIDYASLIVDGEKKYESRKTDSLRPYVGKIVGIVRTGNGPAVAIGQVTIGEPIVVDVEKFNRLRKQHLVPQGSKFDIDSDGTKYLYPMINPVRWDNEKPIKHRGIVSRKIQEQGVTEGLSIDVPNEEWLQDKIDYAKSKGRDEWGAPFFGSTTAYARPNPQVSVVRLELLKGMRNEQNNVRKTDLEWLMATMEKTGKLPLTKQGEEYAPFVMVAYNGEAWVNEGNHRIMAAYRLGWKKMPIEIKYFDGGERVEDGIMYPGKIGLGRPAANPVREAYTGPQLKWLKPGELRGSYTDQQMRDRGFNQTGTGKWFILLSRWNELIAKKGIQ